jgi:hypothetical protein
MPWLLVFGGLPDSADEQASLSSPEILDRGFFRTDRYILISAGTHWTECFSFPPLTTSPSADISNQ